MVTQWCGNQINRTKPPKIKSVLRFSTRQSGTGPFFAFDCPDQRLVQTRHVRLETSRLTLRPLGVDDGIFILELVNEPGWHRFIGDRGIRTLEQAQTYLREGPMRMLEQFGIGLLAVEVTATREPIGICGLIQRDTLPDVDLGFALLERFTRQGYAREAAAATVAYAFDVRQVRRLVAITVPENSRSIGLLAKLGFRYERDLQLRPDSPITQLWAYGTTSTGVPIAT